jgi:hypothetical protein
MPAWVGGHPPRVVERWTTADEVSDLDENALTGALFGRLDDGFLLTGWNDCQALGTTGVREDLGPVFDIGETIVEEREDVGRDLFAETVTGAQVLIDPDLHG